MVLKLEHQHQFSFECNVAKGHPAAGCTSCFSQIFSIYSLFLSAVSGLFLVGALCSMSLSFEFSVLSFFFFLTLKSVLTAVFEFVSVVLASHSQGRILCPLVRHSGGAFRQLHTGVTSCWDKSSLRFTNPVFSPRFNTTAFC